MSAALTVQYDRSPNQPGLFGYSLKVTVTNAVDMPAEIFMFQRGAAPAPTAGEPPRDKFICVADPVDLHETPALAPDLDNEIPYYRLATVTLGFRSADDREELVTLLEGDINGLVTSLRLMETAGESVQVTYP